MLNYMMGRSLQQFLAEPVIIIGLALIACGIAIGFLSRRITRAIRQNNNIQSNDKVFVALKLTGMIFVICGFVCIGANVINYIATR